MKDYFTDIIFKTASHLAGRHHCEVYAVGGCVRDILLRRPVKDIDFVVVGSGIEFARLLASELGTGEVHIYKNFGTALIRTADRDIEFVGARKESYRASSRKPVVENGTLQDDLNRRDFTINSMAVSMDPITFGLLLDPLNGMADLKNKMIRTPLEPGVTFSDDPLRMMRAIRFAAQLGFSIEKNTWESIFPNRSRIKIVSEERITDELNKIILSSNPSTGFRLLFDSGLLQIIFPQLTALQGVENIEGIGHKDNFYHTLKVLDNIAERSDDLWLRWAAILHDIAKPVTKKYDAVAGWTFHGHETVGARMVKTIFRQLRLPMNETMRYVQKLVLLHLRPIILSSDEVTDSAVRRLLFEAGEDIDDLMMLSEADITSKNDAKVARYLKNFLLVRKKLKEVEEKDRLRNFQPPITGETIMQTFGLPPCKSVGIIKEAIREAILEGRIGNNYEEAHQMMMEKGKEMGLTEKSQ